MSAREEYADCIAMAYDERGNALTAFDYTPEGLEAEARRLREAFGEQTTVTYGPSTFITGNSSERRT